MITIIIVLILHSPMEHKNEAFLRSYSLCLSKYSRVSLSSPHLHSPPLRFHMPWLSLALCSLPFPPFFSPASLVCFFSDLLCELPVGTESPLSGICASSWPKSSRRLHRLSKPYSKSSCQINLFNFFPFISDRNCWSYLLFVISYRDTRNKVMQPEDWSLPDNWKY